MCMQMNRLKHKNRNTIIVFLFLCLVRYSLLLSSEIILFKQLFASGLVNIVNNNYWYSYSVNKKDSFRHHNLSSLTFLSSLTTTVIDLSLQLNLVPFLSNFIQNCLIQPADK